MLWGSCSLVERQRQREKERGGERERGRERESQLIDALSSVNHKGLYQG